MASLSQKRELHYRVAKLHKQKGPLQTLVTTALKQLGDPPERTQPLATTGTDYRLINYAYTHGSMLCGNMFVYSAGAAQLLMRAKVEHTAGAEAASYPLDAFTAPSQDGQKREFLESILYFCIHKNHVLLLQSRGLKAGGFEEYLDWLLEKAKLIEPGQVVLADQPTPDAKRAISRSHVKSVSMGMPFIHAETSTQPGQKSARINVDSFFVNAFKGLLGSKMDHLKLADALDGNIKATLELKWMRHTTAPAQNFLDEIAIAMRNVEPDDVAIELNNGAVVKGNELKLTVPVQVRVRNNIVEQTSLYKSMRESVKMLLESGTITP